MRLALPRFSRLALAVPMLLAGVVAASAWTPPSVGRACTGLRGGGIAYGAVAGNYMGGRALQAGVIDYKSFQACFRNEAACGEWLARHARRFPLGPTIASCERVTLR